jgi:hypothetical protein
LIALAVLFARERTKQTARSLFLYSILYLPLLWSALVIDRFSVALTLADLPALNAALNGHVGSLSSPSAMS